MKIPRKKSKTAQCRFNEKYIPDPNSGCWHWDASSNGLGYGLFFAQGKTIGAHRASWELANGIIPDGLYVLHKCDEPSCVNPDHLFLGTQWDNMIDKRAKGRTPRGEMMKNAKLTEPDVLRIRELNGIFSQSELAEMFGVSNSTISMIQHRNAWKHI